MRGALWSSSAPTARSDRFTRSSDPGEYSASVGSRRAPAHAWRGREETAQVKRPAFRDCEYWGGPCPGSDPRTPVIAPVHFAPPGNRPTPDERDPASSPSSRRVETVWKARPSLYSVAYGRTLTLFTATEHPASEAEARAELLRC